ncbi:MAG: NAD kinase [Alphaproteobacteria bacterium]|nr:MAG: NAD kinase [Alphaproteobacteria bacterium]
MKIHFHASENPRPQAAFKELSERYGHHDLETADVIVVLGGDGAMLRALHKFTDIDLPLFGLNFGTLGFLLNEYKNQDLVARISAAQSYEIHPLRMEATDTNGKTYSKLAYNEVSLLRQTHSSAKLMIFVNDEVRMPLLVCDGIMLSTAVGSTAYNSSANGPIIPLTANVLPLTPISAFRPRRWPGALIPNTYSVRFEVIRPLERPVSTSADSSEIRDIASVEICQAADIFATLLFDPDNHLEERIYQEQFAP